MSQQYIHKARYVINNVVRRSKIVSEKILSLELPYDLCQKDIIKIFDLSNQIIFTKCRAGRTSAHIGRAKERRRIGLQYNKKYR
ncbi:MAG TPA: hypothetical protein PLZ05_01135 [Alphaproteobacteria bacterium]|nr:hypothetical protein [Alphaproteobacteria bacterium]